MLSYADYDTNFWAFLTIMEVGTLRVKLRSLEDPNVKDIIRLGKDFN